MDKTETFTICDKKYKNITNSVDKRKRSVIISHQLNTERNRKENIKVCTRPMLRAEVTTKFTKEQMSEFLMIAFKIDDTSETNQTEEESRFGGISDFKSFNDLSFIKDIDNSELERSFNQMQVIYIFSEKDNISFKDVLNNIDELFDKLKK